VRNRSGKILQMRRGGEEAAAPALAGPGPQIRALRVQRGLSGAALAKRVGVSPSLISQIERNISNPSLDVLARIAQALGVTIGNLFEPAPSEESEPERTPDRPYRVAIVRRDRRKVLRLPQWGREFQLLTPDLQRRTEFLWVVVEPGDLGPPDGSVHHSVDGEESFIVIKGRVHLHIGDQVHVLEEGDSATYDTWAPHRIANPEREAAILVTVITPPSF